MSISTLYVFRLISNSVTDRQQLESTVAESAEIDDEDVEDVDDLMDEDAASGDDAEESEDESDGEEEEEEEMGDVDPAFRARVAEALQVSGMGVEKAEDGESSDDDSSDGEVWDDEQMLKVDEQLAAVFRDRAAAGSGKKVDKSEFPPSVYCQFLPSMLMI